MRGAGRIFSLASRLGTRPLIFLAGSRARSWPPLLSFFFSTRPLFLLCPTHSSDFSFFKRPDSRGAGRTRRPRAGPGQARGRTGSGEPASGTPRVGERAPPADGTRDGQLTDGDGPGEADGACDPAACARRRPGRAGPRGAHDGGGVHRSRADAGAGAGGGRREAGSGRVRGGGGGPREEAGLRGVAGSRDVGRVAGRRRGRVAGRRTGRSREAGERARPSRRREAGPGPGAVREQSNPAPRAEMAREVAGQQAWPGEEEGLGEAGVAGRVVGFAGRAGDRASRRPGCGGSGGSGRRMGPNPAKPGAASGSRREVGRGLAWGGDLEPAWRPGRLLQWLAGWSGALWWSGVFEDRGGGGSGHGAVAR